MLEDMAVSVVLAFLLSSFVTSSSAFNFTFDLSEITVLEDEYHNVTFNISSSVSEPPVFIIEDAKIATIYGVSHFIDNNWTLTIKGRRLGRTFVSSRSGEYPRLNIAVLRNESPIVSKLFSAAVSFMVIINTFMMGTQLDFQVIKDVIRRPIAPAIGLTCQFFLMPLIAWGWGTLLLGGMTNLLLSYFTVGCSPGGGNSNQWTILLDGNLDISIAMTFCSNILALGFMPLWLLTVGQMVIAKGTEVKIPFQTLIISLVVLIIPSFFGILLRKVRPTCADQIKKYLKLVMGLSVLIILTFGIYAVRFIFGLLTGKILLCGLLLPWTGFTIAALAAWAFGQPVANIKTIAIETGIQNAGIAMAVLRFSLPQPDADLATVMPVAALIFTPLPLVIVLIGSKVKQRFCKGAVEPKDEKESEMTEVDLKNGSLKKM